MKSSVQTPKNKPKLLILCVSAVFMVAWICYKPGKASRIDTNSGPTPITTQKKLGRPCPLNRGNTSTGDTVKIGLVACVTGELATWGIDAVHAARLAVDEANRLGGVQGKPIELLVEDCASRPEQAKNASEKLASRGVICLVGEMPSGVNMQIANTSYETGIPMIATGASRPELTKIAANIFRACFTTAFQGPAIAEFAYNELGLRKAAIFTDRKQPYCTSLTANFRNKFKKLGGTILAEEFYESGQTQFTPQLTNIKTLNPDALFISGYFTEVGAIARQVKTIGLGATLLGGDGWDSSLLGTYGGEAIVGSFFINHFSPSEKTPEVTAYKKLWFEKYHNNHINNANALAYDTFNVVIEALKMAKSLDSESLTEAMAQVQNHSGVTGPISLLGRNGDPAKGGVVVRVTPDGTSFAKRYDYEDIIK